MAKGIYSWMLRMVIVKEREKNPATWFCKRVHEFSISGSLHLSEVKRPNGSMIKDTVETTYIYIVFLEGKKVTTIYSYRLVMCCLHMHLNSTNLAHLCIIC